MGCSMQGIIPIIFERTKSASDSIISSPVYQGDGALVISARVFHSGEIFVISSRWWYKDFTLLGKEYTCLRNRFHRAKRHNLSNSIIATLDTQAWVAKQAYFKALRKRKKEHWEDFLDNTENIWQATKYLSDHTVKPSFSAIARVKNSLDVEVKTPEEIGDVLLEKFFLCLRLALATVFTMLTLVCRRKPISLPEFRSRWKKFVTQFLKHLHSKGPVKMASRRLSGKSYGPYYSCWFITYPLIICDINLICDVLTRISHLRLVGLSVFKQRPQRRT